MLASKSHIASLKFVLLMEIRITSLDSIEDGSSSSCC